MLIRFLPLRIAKAMCGRSQKTVGDGLEEAQHTSTSALADVVIERYS